MLNFLKELKNINLYVLSVHQTSLAYDMEQIQKQFDKISPDLVVMSHASNVCGLISPIEEVCSMAKKMGSITVVDLCQTAGLLDISFNSNIYDFGVFAGHKTLYGPYGISGFFTSGSTPVKPLLYGGTGADSANETVPTTTPERFEVGSQNSYALSGLNASLQWILAQGTSKLRNKDISDKEQLTDLLKGYDFINLIGVSSESEQLGIISTIFSELPCENVGMILREQGVEVRTGLQCAPQAHRFLGTFPSGTVRFSCGYFQTEKDFATLKKALDYISNNLN